MGRGRQLSDTSRKVLSLIAEGYSYSQIVDGNPDITYLDIFSAADEALQLSEAPSDYQSRMEAIRAHYPNAYLKWTARDDTNLV